MTEDTRTEVFNGHHLTVAHHDVGSRDLVIFCHGFRSSNIGPNRLFVTAARMLANNGISSLRFDQFGSGNSDGDFVQSSFNDWVTTIRVIAAHHIGQTRQVVVWGQSMGAAAAITAAAEIPKLRGLVAWVPDPNIGDVPKFESAIVEEGGEVVGATFWKEAYESRVVEKLKQIAAPVYIVQCTADEYVDVQNRAAIDAAAGPQHIVECLDGWPHSAWTYEQARTVIEKSIGFVMTCFGSEAC